MIVEIPLAFQIHTIVDDSLFEQIISIKGFFLHIELIIQGTAQTHFWSLTEVFKLSDKLRNRLICRILPLDMPFTVYFILVLWDIAEKEFILITYAIRYCLGSGL